MRRRLNAYNGYQPRRPQISAPMDFRHVDHAPFAGRKQNFRPLELSIYMPENQLSPILNHFGTGDDIPSDPRNKQLPAFPPAVMTHTRSESALSHRIARKPLRSSSRASMDWNQNARPVSIEAQELMAALDIRLPQEPAPARLRSMTAPAGYERVKSALHEKHELEQKLRDIDEAIEERKSIYMNSRPTSRATSRARSIYAETQGEFFDHCFECSFNSIRSHASTSASPFLCRTGSHTLRLPSQDCPSQDSTHPNPSQVFQ